MLDYIACLVVRLANKISALIPISVSLWFGRRIGSAAFFFNKKRRMIAYANLKAAFCEEKTPHELKLLTKRVYQNLLQTFIEILNLTKVNKKYIDTYVEVVNLERVQSASESGRGVILLTGHFGDWELSNLTSPFKGFPITVLAREQKMKRLNELLNRLRESKGCKVVRKGISTKNILKVLYAKEMVGILSDQDAGKNGMFVDFFGRPTSTHSGPMEMARRTDAIILPNFIVRVKGPYHKLYLEEYIDFRTSRGADDVRENLQRFTRILESYVRKYPDQWLWLHKRWKSTPARTVLVLDDGRKGHLNQSLAVARHIRKARTTQGYALEDTRIVVVEARFKNPAARAMLGACAAFASWRCHGCMRCMRLCLEKNAYETLMKTYAEFVVSCGSGVSAVNVFMAKENNARNVVVMKPGIFGWLGKFNLAIIPEHDRPPRARNVCATALAPNLVDKDELKTFGHALAQRIRTSGGDFIGLLVGGDNPEFVFTKEKANAIIDQLLESCKETGARLLATTSRRTPRAVEALLKERLGRNPRCEKLIIANEDNVEGIVPGILSLSRLVVVSGESISMVSEAISAGKRTIVFELDKTKDAVAKHERAMKRLEADGYLTIAKAEGLASAIGKAWRDNRPPKEPADSERIFEAVRRLI